MSPHLFRLDASIRANSVSRAVADTFQRAWTAEAPGGPITQREVGREPLPYLTESDATASTTVPQERTPQQHAVVERSGRLWDELAAADVLLLAVPLYNWSVPAPVKSWLDHLLTEPRALAEPTPLAGRFAVIVSARGGAYGAGTPKHGWDHAEPYLRHVLEDLLGREVSVILPELTLASVTPAMLHLQDQAAESLRQAHSDADATARQLVTRFTASASADLAL
jgi:FMN-dependent NADH-azoreductase